MIPGDEQNLNEEWYCFVCQAKNNPRAQDEHGGPFGELMTTLDKKNPAAFHLPKDIRELFEDVKTGAEGEYEEIVPPKPKYVHSLFSRLPLMLGKETNSFSGILRAMMRLQTTSN